jgi:hypothetical protein
MDNTPLQEWWAPPGQNKYLLGSDDQIAFPENGELLKQEMGVRVTLISFPGGAGHLLVATEPKKAAEAVASFLQSLPIQTLCTPSLSLLTVSCGQGGYSISHSMKLSRAVRDAR